MAIISEWLVLENDKGTSVLFFVGGRNGMRDARCEMRDARCEMRDARYFE
ncbi:hypothetical protein VCHA48P442_180070 [Vibrio chagasii]|nr:hypothetical protein VCHA48P442_180070 [Vibrio chagasii]